MLIKVCGLREWSNMLQVDALHPDLMGIIYHHESPRFVKENVIPKTTTPKVGVFVDSSIHHIIHQAGTYDFSYIQLHGVLDLTIARELHRKGFKVIKAFSIGQKIENSFMQKFVPYCTYFLLDTKGDKPGGTGIKFNWQILENYQLETPFLLSGGIGPEDVELIKSIHHPAFEGVDINSRFETSPGVKNIELIKMFINEIKK